MPWAIDEPGTRIGRGPFALSALLEVLISDGLRYPGGMRRRGSWILALRAGIGLSMAGCHPPHPDADRSAQRAPLAVDVSARTDDDPSVEEPPPGPTAAIDLARVLPSDTMFFIGFRDLFAAEDAAGREELLARFASERRELAEASRRYVGCDMTVPEEVAALGLAPHGPAGYASIDGHHSTEVLLFTVAASRTLRARLLGSAETPFTVERLGGVEVYHGPSNSDFDVITDRGVAIFLPEGRRRGELAQRLKKHGPLERLDRAPSFQAALAELPSDADAVLFADVLRSQDGDSPEARLLQGLEGIGATAQLAADHVEADITVVLKPHAPLRELTATLRPPPPGVSALEHFGAQPPVMALDLSVDPEAAFAVTRDLLNRSSALDDRLATIFASARELVTHATGELGVMCRPALVTTPPRDESAAFLPTRCDGTVVLGLRDPASTRRMLERLARSRGGDLLTRSGQDFAGKGPFDGYRFAIRGRTLVITEDVAGLTALGQRWPDTASWTWSRGSERAPIEFRLELDRLLREFDDDGIVWHEPMELRLGGPGEPAAARAKRRELERLVAERHRLERARAVEAARMRLEAARAVGSATVAFSPTRAGLRGHATVRPGAASFGATWLAFADAISTVRVARERDSESLRSLQARIDELALEIETMLSQTP
ncbi:MAG: hypothetical protein JW751_08250 [Polyangiaceae bacterium]|nr:hypothetical protein [Polyangiaceae bacterium]